MGFLRRYLVMCNYMLDPVEFESYNPVKEHKKIFIESQPVTLANISPITESFITAHDLRDYRRTSFNLVLLPEITLPYDKIAEEVYNLSEYL